MVFEHHTTEQFKQYVLGTISAEEKVLLEDEYFADHELFEEIEIVEDELIDAYIHGALPADDLEWFEKKLATSSRLTERVNFARILAQSTRNVGPITTVDSPSFEPQDGTSTTRARSEGVLSEENPFWRKVFSSQSPLRWALAACFLLLVFGGGTFLFQTIRLREESQRLALEQAQLEERNKARERELELQNAQRAQAPPENERQPQHPEVAPKKEPPAVSRNPSLAFFLTPGGMRGIGRTNSVTVSSKSPGVRLFLVLESDEYSSYSATIKTVEDGEIWADSGLKSQTRNSRNVVELKVPTSRLTKRSYIVELTGRSTAGTSEPVHQYSFRVDRN